MKPASASERQVYQGIARNYFDSLSGKYAGAVQAVTSRPTIAHEDRPDVGADPLVHYRPGEMFLAVSKFDWPFFALRRVAKVDHSTGTVWFMGIMDDYLVVAQRNDYLALLTAAEKQQIMNRVSGIVGRRDRQISQAKDGARVLLRSVLPFRLDHLK